MGEVNNHSRRDNANIHGGRPVEVGGKAPGSIELAESLLPRIRRVAEGPNRVIFLGSASGKEDRSPDVVSWGELHRDACEVAAALQARGVAPGDHVALLSPTTRSLVTAVQGIWLAGGCVIMLPIPMRFSSVDEFMNQVRAHVHHGDARLLLVDGDLSNFYEPKEGDPPVVLLSDVQPGPGRPSANGYREVPDDPHRLAILQFTSGSTADPKGVMLPHHVLGANLDGMVEAAEVKPDDIFVSWLPLYHDMGLVGMLTVPMTSGCSLVLASPQDFMARPGDWMRWMSDYGGTVTAGPNFSWVLATRALKRMISGDEKLDLSPIRIALNGSEPVDPDGVEEFVASARPHGLAPDAVFCAFGMAELALGGSFPPPMRGMACDSVDRTALESEAVARVAGAGVPVRKLPLLGRPVPGLEMRICDPESGEIRGIREVGELEISGSSVTSGYYNRPDLTARIFRDGWLRTGDLAYFVDSPDGGPPELVICGRIKDVIIISGRNIFPEDIERAVGLIDGVRAGNVIAFSVEGFKGKESIVVAAEVRAADPGQVRREIRNRTLGVCGATPGDIVLIQPGTLPKTSSGKLQRSLCRQQYLRKDLKVI